MITKIAISQSACQQAPIPAARKANTPFQAVNFSKYQGTNTKSCCLIECIKTIFQKFIDCIRAIFYCKRKPPSLSVEDQSNNNSSSSSKQPGQTIASQVIPDQKTGSSASAPQENKTQDTASIKNDKAAAAADSDSSISRSPLKPSLDPGSASTIKDETDEFASYQDEQAKILEAHKKRQAEITAEHKKRVDEITSKSRSYTKISSLDSKARSIASSTASLLSTASQEKLKPAAESKRSTASKDGKRGSGQDNKTESKSTAASADTPSSNDVALKTQLIDLGKASKGSPEDFAKAKSLLDQIQNPQTKYEGFIQFSSKTLDKTFADLVKEPIISEEVRKCPIELMKRARADGMEVRIIFRRLVDLSEQTMKVSYVQKMKINGGTSVHPECYIYYKIKRAFFAWTEQMNPTRKDEYYKHLKTEIMQEQEVLTGTNISDEELFEVFQPNLVDFK